jgi:hypothetical protein
VLFYGGLAKISEGAVPDLGAVSVEAEASTLGKPNLVVAGFAGSAGCEVSKIGFAFMKGFDLFCFMKGLF